MKLPDTKATLAIPLLSLAMALSASSFAAAPDNTGTIRHEPDDRANQQTQSGDANSPQYGDITHTPSQHACENSHAPTGAPELADSEHPQGANLQEHEPVSGADAAENQSAEDTREQIALAGDDCLDANSTLKENARGQGTGTSPDSLGGDGNRQTRDTQD